MGAMEGLIRTPIWYVAILAVLRSGFVVCVALAFWAAQTWQWRLVETGRIPEFAPWKRPYVTRRRDLPRPSLSSLPTVCRVTKRDIVLLFRADPDPELEALRQRTARLVILTVSIGVAEGVALLMGGLMLALTTD
jgi:hypothetical protein